MLSFATGKVANKQPLFHNAPISKQPVFWRCLRGDLVEVGLSEAHRKPCLICNEYKSEELR